MHHGYGKGLPVADSISEAYFARIRRMKPEQRIVLAIEITDAIRRIAIKGIMDSEKVNYSRAKKVLRERMSK